LLPSLAKPHILINLGKIKVIRRAMAKKSIRKISKTTVTEEGTTKTKPAEMEMAKG